MRKVHNEYLGYRFELPDEVRRVVCLVSSATEVMDKMGLLDRVVGVSEYCDRYVDVSGAEVVGRYLDADFEAIAALEPDLIVTTTGIQRGLAGRFMKAELPIYQLALPSSFEGMLENVMVLGGLLNEMGRARELVRVMRGRGAELRGVGTVVDACGADHELHESHELKIGLGGVKPKVYVELWLGRHMRGVGGFSYIADLVEMAGGELMFIDRAEGYFVPDFEEAGEADVFVCFHEPEFLVDGEGLARERGWGIPVVMSTVDVGENMIQDGPSFLDTAVWLRGELGRVLGR